MNPTLRLRDGSVSNQDLANLMARCAEGGGELTPPAAETLENLRTEEIVLAFDGPAPAGVCVTAFKPGEREAALRFLGVLPEHRRADVAGRLLAQAEKVAFRNGYGSLRTAASIASDNKAPVRLLERSGWKPEFGASLRMWRELKHLPEAKPPAGYGIRTYETGDDAAFVRIKNAAFLSENVGGRAWTVADFEKEYLDSPYFSPERVLFAVCNGEPVGTTTAWSATYRGREVGLIHWVAVVPEHRKKGLGLVLNVRALHRLKALGYGEATLNTSERLESAVRLYHRLGFEVVVRRAHYRKTLSSAANH